MNFLKNSIHPCNQHSSGPFCVLSLSLVSRSVWAAQLVSVGLLTLTPVLTSRFIGASLLFGSVMTEWSLLFLFLSLSLPWWCTLSLSQINRLLKKVYFPRQALVLRIKLRCPPESTGKQCSFSDSKTRKKEIGFKTQEVHFKKLSLFRFLIQHMYQRLINIKK